MNDALNYLYNIDEEEFKAYLEFPKELLIALLKDAMDWTNDKFLNEIDINRVVQRAIDIRSNERVRTDKLYKLVYPDDRPKIRLRFNSKKRKSKRKTSRKSKRKTSTSYYNFS